MDEEAETEVERLLLLIERLATMIGTINNNMLLLAESARVDHLRLDRLEEHTRKAMGL